MHLALNPSGNFDRSGYRHQPSLVLERIADSAVNVLELACGNGYNLGLLAERKPSHCFIGIDLVPGQVDRANASLGSFSNATASVGDFQDLSFTDDSQDVVFAIESFCHATDLQRAFSEVYRVLRPGGLFIVIDAWRTEVYPTAPEIVRMSRQGWQRCCVFHGAQLARRWRRASPAGCRGHRRVPPGPRTRPPPPRAGPTRDRSRGSARLFASRALVAVDQLAAGSRAPTATRMAAGLARRDSSAARRYRRRRRPP